MTITSSGARCDVCGNYILPIDLDEMVNAFSMKGIQGTLHCHNKCKALLEDLQGQTERWKELPEGPIKELFQKQEEKA